MKIFIKQLLAVGLLCLSVFAQEGFRPFVLASISNSSLEESINIVKAKLQKSKLDIVGEYSPYKNAYIIAVSDDGLRKNALATKFGAFGSVIRVSITKINNAVQVSFNNPIYLSYAYRMKNKPMQIFNKLKESLGYVKEFGTKDSYSKDDLSSYHYKIFMPYFDDEVQIAKYKSYQDAIFSIEKGLANNYEGVSQVYRIDLGDNKTSMFGVSMSKKASSDEFVMSEIDFKTLKSTSHLPYEILVVDDKAYILPAKFRIAINFPELSMMGANSFMNIMSTPSDIKDALSHSID